MYPPSNEAIDLARAKAALIDRAAPASTSGEYNAFHVGNMALYGSREGAYSVVRLTTTSMIDRYSKGEVWISRASLNRYLAMNDLSTMRDDEEQADDDFISRPTDFAYELTRQMIEDTYQGPIANGPRPTFAPDGRGGIITEWKVDRKEVRLVIPENEIRRAYIYTRVNGTSDISYQVTSENLASSFRRAFA